MIETRIFFNNKSFPLDADAVSGRRKAAKLTNSAFRETIEVLDEVPEWTWGSQDA
jgi:hypothetical protein